MNRLIMLVSACVISFAIGCERDSATTQTPAKPAPPPAPVAKGDDHDHDHDHPKGAKGDAHEGEKHDLGTQQAGSYTLKATRIGEMKSGGEAVFEIAVSGGTSKPTALRAWVGTETGAGSAKAKGEAGENDYDVHIEVPDPLPANSKLWVELEVPAGRQKASFNLPA